MNIEEIAATYTAAGIKVEGTGKNLIASYGCTGNYQCFLNLTFEEFRAKVDYVGGGYGTQVFRFDDEFYSYEVGTKW